MTTTSFKLPVALAAWLEDEAKAHQKPKLVLLNVGSVECPANLAARKRAAWMMVANVLLNLDETITKG
ncbi:MAG: hypothetical protein HY043_14785 [Verrucomicrobia bacterium]|nr:hypothetical protein [Verrucomicrobiota bacterium]